MNNNTDTMPLQADQSVSIQTLNSYTTRKEQQCSCEAKHFYSSSAVTCHLNREKDGD